MLKMKRNKNNSEKRQKSTRGETNESKNQRKRSQSRKIKNVSINKDSGTNTANDLKQTIGSKYLKIGSSSSNAPSPSDQLSNSSVLPSCGYKTFEDVSLITSNSNECLPHEAEELMNYNIHNSDDFLKQLKDTNHNVFKNLYDKNLHELVICNLIEDNSDNILKCLLTNAKANNTNLLETILDRCFELKKPLTGTKGKMISLIQLILLDTGSLLDLLIGDIIKPKTGKEFFTRDQSCFYIWAIYYSGTDRIQVLNDIFVAAFKNDEISNNLGENKDEKFQYFISKVLYKKYNSGASILHEMASEGRVIFIQDLIRWLQDNNYTNIIVDLLFMMDSGKNSFLQVLNYHKSLTSFLSFLFETLEKYRFQNLIKHTNADGQTIFHNYMMRTINGYDALNSYLTFLADNFTKRFISGIIYKIDNSGCTAFHYVFKDSTDYKEFRLLLQFAISRFEPNKYSSSSQEAVLNNAYDDMALKALVDACKTSFNQDIFKSFTLIDKWGKTIFHHMVASLTSNTNKVFDGFLDFLTNYLGVENVQKLFLITPNKKHKQTVLHLASRRHNETLQSLLDYILEKFDLKTVITLILRQDLYGHTCLHNAGQCSSEKPMLILLNFAAANLPVDVLNKMLRAKNKQKQNVFHLAANNYFSSVSNSDPLPVLLAFYIKNCDTRVLFRQLFLQKDDHNKTYLDLIRYRMDRFILEIKIIFDQFIETLGKLTSTDLRDTDILTKSEVILLHQYVEVLFDGIYLKQIRQKYILKLDEYLKKCTVFSNKSK